MLAASTRNGEFRNDFLRAKARPRDFSVLWTGSFAMISMRERGGTKRILPLQLEARLEFELRCALRSIKSRRSRRGGIGRRAGLKIQWPQGRVGSSPSAGRFLDIGVRRSADCFVLV